MAVHIKAVQPGSPAAGVGVQPGMQLLEINSHPIRDGLDYEFYSAAAQLALLVRTAQGAQQSIAVQKEEYQPLGCEFASYLIDKQRSCKNKCVFCFIDQLPKGMRPSLYFKDDDERLGFLFGNYITLTNLSQREVDRIIEMRFSPVNISVHTTNPALRVQMMANPKAGEVLGHIPRLAAAGIAMNFQLVLCPGLNDGAHLAESIAWLAACGNAVQSIAAVPVGLTCHRQGLAPLRPYTKAEAAAQLDIMLAAGEDFLRRRGTRLIYPSDEWFTLAGRPIPEGDFYEEYPQLENGVGMQRLLEDEFIEALEDAPGGNAAGTVDIVVGEMAAPQLRALAQRLQAKYPKVQLAVHAVRNDFFGPRITVTGLLTGRDVAAQLRGRLQGGVLLLPQNTLRAEGDVMLDDMSPEELGRRLGVQVRVLPQGGDALLEAILDGI